MANTSGRSQADLELEFTGSVYNYGSGDLAELRYSNPKLKSIFGCTFCMNAHDLNAEIERRSRNYARPLIGEYVRALSALNELKP